jgi:hypothetical protein
MNTFATKPNIQRKALQKALKSPLIGKHGKRRVTLLKEEVFKEIQQRILERAEILINAQIEVALKGKGGKADSRTIDSLLNRAFGKPAQFITLNETRTEVTEEDKEVANMALKQFISSKDHSQEN